MKLDPKLDLVLERNIDVPVDLAWAAWTQPEHLKKWFCPKPWYVSECWMDLRPGGEFRTIMRGPNGEVLDNPGCYLAIEPQRKIVFTDALEADFRPNRQTNPPFPFRFTAHVLFEPLGKDASKYTAIVQHTDEASAKKHDEIGFSAGWAAALAQMIDEIKSGRIR